eukprot:m.56780 g.56780  ORF g.56780 m.56780 type:complete len:525 (-) comp7812_c0_seq8:3457-5031(-)
MGNRRKERKSRGGDGGELHSTTTVKSRRRFIVASSSQPTATRNHWSPTSRFRKKSVSPPSRSASSSPPSQRRTFLFGKHINNGVLSDSNTSSTTIDSRSSPNTLKRNGDLNSSAPPHSVKLVDVGHKRKDNLCSDSQNEVNDAWSYFVNALKKKRSLFNEQSLSKDSSKRIFIACGLSQSLLVLIMEPIILKVQHGIGFTLGVYAIIIIIASLLSAIFTLHGMTSMTTHEFYGALLLNILSALYCSLQLFEIFDNPYPNHYPEALTIFTLIIIAILILVQAIQLAPIYEKVGGALFSIIPSPSVQELLHSYNAIRVILIIIACLNSSFVITHLALFLDAKSTEILVLVPLMCVDILNACIPSLLIYSPKFHLLLYFSKVWLLCLAGGYLFKVIQLDLGFCEYCRDENILSLSLSSSVNLVVVMIAIGILMTSHRSMKENMHLKQPKLRIIAPEENPKANIRINSQMELDTNAQSDFKFVHTPSRTCRYRHGHRYRQSMHTRVRPTHARTPSLTHTLLPQHNAQL